MHTKSARASPLAPDQSARGGECAQAPFWWAEFRLCMGTKGKSINAKKSIKEKLF